MSERIEQLLKQATVVTEGWCDVRGTTRYYSVDYKKFAQLIVDDCVEIVEPCKCGCCQGEPEGIIADTIIKQIKQHFGLNP